MNTPPGERTLPIWIDRRELDELQAKYACVPRTQLSALLQAYWPVRRDVEDAIERLIAASRPSARAAR